jgi:glycosyltransferase involved in cell wall biosynthesis
MFIANGWDSSTGGIATVNRELARQFKLRVDAAKLDWEVWCLITDPTSKIPPQSERYKVKILHCLQLPDEVPDAVKLVYTGEMNEEPAVVLIGHGKFTGLAAVNTARTLRGERLSPGQPGEAELRLPARLNGDARSIYMYHVHSPGIEGLKGNSSDLRGYTKGKVEKDGMKHADLALGVGPKLKSDAQSLFHAEPGKRPRIEEIKLGMLGGRGYGPSNSALKDRKEVLWIGRAEEGQLKGLVLYGQGAKILMDRLTTEDFSFAIVGAAGEQAAIDVRDALVDQGARADKLTVLPFFTERKDALERLKAARLVVMPSLDEPFGLVALEALSYATPVVVSKNSGVGKVISPLAPRDISHQDLAHTVVDVGSKDAAARLATAIDWHLNSPTDSQNLATHLRDLLIQRGYTYSDGAQQLIGFIQGLLPKPAR